MCAQEVTEGLELRVSSGAQLLEDVGHVLPKLGGAQGQVRPICDPSWTQLLLLYLRLPPSFSTPTFAPGFLSGWWTGEGAAQSIDICKD